jgi:hypothetical protein
LSAARFAIPFALASAVLLPGAAHASTTVGYVPSGPPGDSCGMLAGTYVDKLSVIGSSGVVTSFHSAFAGYPATQIRYFVARPTGTLNTYAVVGGVDGTVDGAGTVTSATRIAVQAGDVLGVTKALGGNFNCTGTVSGASGVAGLLTELGDDASSLVTTLTLSNARLNVRATVEPDDDGDGYGDESQDACLGSPTHLGPCAIDLQASAALVGDAPRAGGTATVVFTVQSAGTAATGAKLVVSTASTPLSLIGDGCTGSTCTFGTLSNGATRRVVAVVRVAEGGWSISGTASSSGIEQVPANNTATYSGNAAEAFVATKSQLEAAVAEAAKPAAPSVSDSSAAAEGPRCVVPSLKGASIPAATTALAAAGCKLGAVTGVKASKGKPRVVGSQSAAPGSKLAAGASVAVVMKRQTAKRGRR